MEDKEIQGSAPKFCQLKGHFATPAYHTNIIFVFTIVTVKNPFLTRTKSDTLRVKLHPHSALC